MRYAQLIYLFTALLSLNCAFAQGRFLLPKNVSKEKIKVKIVNNLIVIPVHINGVELSMLLDTGVRSTILFNANSNLKLNNETKVVLTGAGAGEDAEAIKSTHNIINIGASSAINQTIVNLSDNERNFSSRLGFPVNGIIGYALFKDFIVEINYAREYINLYNKADYKRRNCRSCVTIPLEFHSSKPYALLQMQIAKNSFLAKLLVDTGSGDALWLFEESHKGITIPDNSFKDNLGLGFNGEVTGVRSKLDRLDLGDISLEKVNVAYPDLNSINYINRLHFRNGSLGSEVLKRFTVVIDYNSKKMLLKKNRFFDEPFKYDRSGLVIQHNGSDIIAEYDRKIIEEFSGDQQSGGYESVFLATNTVEFKQFKLSPNYEVAAIREESPGSKAGLRVGDKLIKINGKKVRNLKLQDITRYFYRDEGEVLKLEILRGGIAYDYKFALKKILQD